MLLVLYYMFLFLFFFMAIYGKLSLIISNYTFSDPVYHDGDGVGVRATPGGDQQLVWQQWTSSSWWTSQREDGVCRGAIPR